MRLQSPRDDVDAALLLALPTTVAHRIDKHSPLYPPEGWTPPPTTTTTTNATTTNATNATPRGRFGVSDTAVAAAVVALESEGDVDGTKADVADDGVDVADVAGDGDDGVNVADVAGDGDDDESSESSVSSVSTASEWGCASDADDDVDDAVVVDDVDENQTHNHNNNHHNSSNSSNSEKNRGAMARTIS